MQVLEPGQGAKQFLRWLIKGRFDGVSYGHHSLSFAQGCSSILQGCSLSFTQSRSRSWSSNRHETFLVCFFRTKFIYDSCFFAIAAPTEDDPPYHISASGPRPAKLREELRGERDEVRRKCRQATLFMPAHVKLTHRPTRAISNSYVVK